MQPFQKPPKRKNKPAILLSIVAVILFISLGYMMTENSELQVKLLDKNAELAKLNDQMSLVAGSGNVSFTKGVNNIFAIGYCVEPNHALVRDMATLIVAGAPVYADSNDDIWKIWQINNWVHFNISYVSDPLETEYFAAASETLVTRAGDCDDMATLTASMLEAVGMDAGLAFVDADGDGKEDHLAAVIHYSGDKAKFLADEQHLMNAMNVVSSTGQLDVMCFSCNDKVLDDNLRGKYEDGVWIVIDPDIDIPGYIPEGVYTVTLAIEAGG